MEYITCPDYPDPTSSPDEEPIMGCGSTNVVWDTEESLYECLDCGMCFTVESRERS